MSDIKDLFTQSSHYFFGHLLIAAAGIASFPILTRLFTVSDYGVLNLINTTLFVTIGICKLGMPNAVVRFYARAEKECHLKTFYVTIVSSVAMGGLIGGSLLWITANWIFKSHVPMAIKGIMGLLFGVVVCGCVTDTVTSFLRAQQRTKIYNFILVGRKYGGLLLGVCLAISLKEKIAGFFWGQLIGTALFLGTIMFLVRLPVSMKRPVFSGEIVKQAFAFGFPLIWAELGHLLLNYADRYLIQFYLGAESLGIYTAGYNLATHVAEGIMYPINYAMTPIYLSILINKGINDTKMFFTKMFTYFLLLLLPCIFGFIAVSKELIILLATDKYIQTSVIIPYIIVGQGIYSCSILLNSGLFIAKKTRIVTYTMAAALILNIGLNILLIPVYGIVGAAFSTLVSFIIYTIVVTWFAFKEFSFNIQVKRIFGFFISSIAMYIFSTYCNIYNGIGSLLVKVALGIFCYSVLIFFIDKELRKKIIKFINKAK